MTLQDFYTSQEESFDSFCKNLIRNESINAHKEYSRRARNEVSLSTLDPNQLEYTSDCPVSERFVAQGHAVYVSDAALSDALRFLPPIHREIILLSFFLELSDVEIGRLLQVDARTIGYRRKAALKKLRYALEAQEP